MDTDRTLKDSESVRSGHRSVSPSSSVSEFQFHTSEIRLGFQPCPRSPLDILHPETDFTPCQGIHIRPRRAHTLPLHQDSTVQPRETPSTLSRQETPKSSVHHMSFVHQLLKPDVLEQQTRTRTIMAHLDSQEVVDQQSDHHCFPADSSQPAATMHPPLVQRGCTPFRRSPSLHEQYAPQALRCYGQVFSSLTYQQQKEQRYTWQAHYYAQNRASVKEERYYQYHHDLSQAFTSNQEGTRMSREKCSRRSVTPVQLALGSENAPCPSRPSLILTSDDGRDNNKSDITDKTRKHCENCGARETPAWRRCAQTAKLLCNACGLCQKYYGVGRPLKTSRGRRYLSQQPQQQGAATEPIRTSLESAHCRPYPSSSKMKDKKSETEKEVGKKAGLPMKRCKICGVKTSSIWHLAPPGAVSGVICDHCCLQAKLHKVGEKLQQRIGHRGQVSGRMGDGDFEPI